MATEYTKRNHQLTITVGGVTTTPECMHCRDTGFVVGASDDCPCDCPSGHVHMDRLAAQGLVRVCLANGTPHITRPKWLCLQWVKWPGSGDVWPVGEYLGRSKANSRHVWGTRSPFSFADIALQLPDYVHVARGPFELTPGWFDGAYGGENPWVEWNEHVVYPDARTRCEQSEEP